MNVYVYLLDTLADWETGFIISELNSKRFFKKDAAQVELKTISCTHDPIKTMGGMTVIPDGVTEEIMIDKETVLILPGADTWSNPMHNNIIRIAEKVLAADGTVCAICGATVALAHAGILDHYKHTSNGNGFLEMFAPEYRGKELYQDMPSVQDRNLITAGTAGGLLWAKQILEKMEVFRPDTLNAWYNFFSTGKAEFFFELMQTISNSNVGK